MFDRIGLLPDAVFNLASSHTRKFARELGSTFVYFCGAF